MLAAAPDVTHPISDLAPVAVEAGLGFSLSPSISADVTTFRWSLNGRALAAQKAASLSVASARPADAGTYQLKVVNQSGVVFTRDFQVTVYERINKVIPLRSSAPLELPTRFWGKGSVSWSVYDDPALYAGRFHRTLVLLSPAWFFDSAYLVPSGMNPFPPLTATLTVGSASIEIAHYDLEDHLPPEIVSAPSGMYTPSTGYGGVVVAAGRSDPPVTFRATGLPPGTSLDEQGFWMVDDFRPGTYQVTWTAQNALGSSSKTTVIQFAEDQPGGPYPEPGTYSGLFATGPGDFIYQESDFPCGYLKVQVLASGRYSGQLRSKKGTLRFSGTFRPDEDGIVAPVQIPGLVTGASLSLSKDEDGFIRATITDEGGAVPTSGGVLWPVKSLSRAEQKLHVGDHSGFFDFQSGGSPDKGQGFGTKHISANTHSANFFGTLPDGTGFTIGTELVKPGHKYSPAFGLPCFYHASASMSTLLGLGTPSGYSAFVWFRLPNPQSRVFPEGFKAISTAYFYKRRALRPGQLLLTDTPVGNLNARFEANLDMKPFLNQPLTLTAASTAIIPKPNLSKLKIDIYGPTGFFTGKFEFDPASAGVGLGGAKRMVSFRGMIIPGMNYGAGFFLTEVPSNNPLPAPQYRTLSGAVNIFQNP
ncbi:immunoglobulin domain-containing protein [Brevifollis gellanilyticus]|nr:hypothetical protein [Brevifollis gellanilyticus]